MADVLITGGSGFIGRRLVQLLVKEGYGVRAVSRSLVGKKLLENLGAEVVLADIRDYRSMESAVANVATIFHLAGIVSYRYIDRKLMMSVNLLGTRNLLELVEKYHTPKLIVCSSVVVLGGSDGQMLDETAKHDEDCISYYEKSKYLAYQEVMSLTSKRSGIVVALPALAMGPGDADILGIYIKAFREGKLPFLVRMNRPISYVFVDDLARGLYLCMTKGKSGEQYIFSSGSCTPGELALLLEKYTGKKRPSIQLSPRLAKPFLILDEVLASMTGRQPPLTVESLRVLEKRDWVYSGQKAINELEWKPRNLDEMVRDSVGVRI